MKKWIFIGLGVMVLLLSVAGFIKKENSLIATPTKEVTTFVAQSGQTSQKNIFGSFVRNSDEAIVSAQISGNISKVYVKEGDKVRHGQVLASISAPEFVSKYKTTQTQLQIAQEQEKRARRDWDDYKPEEREQYKLYSQQAQAMQSEAGAYLAKTRIVAPFDGIVSKKFVQTGATVMPGTQIMYLVGDEQYKEVVIEVPTSVGEKLFLEDEVEIKNDNKVATGQIIAISPVSDSMSRKTTLRIALDNTNEFVLGEFVDVVISSNQDDIKGTKVPQVAIVKEYNDTFVFVLENQKAKMKKVEILGQDGEYVIINGVEPGENVIVSGAHELSDNQEVKVSE
jgi:RND family efflux transporter MFP subunit